MSDWGASCWLSRVSLVSSQLVRGQVGGVQPELRRRGADAAGRLRPEEQPDPRRRPGWLWLCPADTCQAAGLQHSQLSPGVDHSVVVTGKAAWKWVSNSRHTHKRKSKKEDDNSKPSFDGFTTFYESDLSGFTTVQCSPETTLLSSVLRPVPSALCPSTGFTVKLL